MIVLDASAMVEALVGRSVDNGLLEVLAGDLAAPHLLDVEVLSALRGLELGHRLAAAAAERARLDHFAFAITRFDLEPLSGRIWKLRHQFTTYDASYIALAEVLSIPLYTCDAKLATGSHTAHVEVIGRIG